MRITRFRVRMQRAAGSGLSTASLQILNGWWSVSNLLFPAQCRFCQVLLPVGQARRLPLCRSCVDLLVSPDSGLCRRCAAPVPLHWQTSGHWQTSAHCPLCVGDRYFFRSVVALGAYRADLKRAVLAMKATSGEPLAKALGMLLAGRVCRLSASLPFDRVVPIPMHWQRRVRRGIQTSRGLAVEIGRTFAIPVDRHLLYCRRKTRKQGTLRPSERRRNMRGAYSVSSGYDITDARLLLVDDVMTTGATVNEAARTLRRAGARSVAVAVVARGTGGR